MASEPNPVETDLTETSSTESTDQTFLVDGRKLAAHEFFDYHSEKVSEYVKHNLDSPNTKLFSILALLNAYIPESHLHMSECLQILGPLDPIHGGPPFEERMEPFTEFIDTSSPERVRMSHPVFAQKAVELFAKWRISRSATVKKFMFSLCGDEPQRDTIEFIKSLLTKREKGKKGREKFSRLIDDIYQKETFSDAVSVLETASKKLEGFHIFPQTISRLYYIKREDYKKAKKWAKTAIKRAPSNSYVADTLGQVYKNRLIWKAKQSNEIFSMADVAFKAFKAEENKAYREEGPEMEDTAGTVSISGSFNNRGLFGFMQVAKIAFEKLIEVGHYSSQKHKFIQTYKMEVEDKFDFFEWYLTYSKPDMTTSEPYYFWKDVVSCYEHYTEKKAAESTSFPGLLDCLNRCLFTSKGGRAGFEEYKITVSKLEAIQDDLKTTYEANTDDVKAAERYILSNIVLSNKMHNSPKLTPVEELQTILQRFLGTEEGRRSPEFYLLVLLLFWPDEQDMDAEQETRAEPAPLSHEHKFDPDLQQHVTFMERAYQRAGYAKYLRGRYLFPLFLLGRGSGLSKWIHKSRLDEIVENMVDAELAAELAAELDKKKKKRNKMKEKWRRINNMWISGKVWEVPKIKDILLPVRVKPCHPPREAQEHKVSVCAGGKKIMATAEAKPDASATGYLGFTIRGPVLFKVGFPHILSLSQNEEGADWLPLSQG